MTRRPTISTYTPSNTDPEVLERIFVQREILLTQIVARFANGMAGSELHHALFVGPRGCGKTHMVTLTRERLKNMPGLANSMRIAWLGEDSVFTGLIDLALAIADELAAETPDEFKFDYRGSVRGLPADEAAIEILNTIVKRLESRNLLLIIENMNRLFSGLGDSGQKKWRSFLQENRRFASLTSAQQLFEGVKSRNQPFFGFFDIHHLTPLSVEQAHELIQKLATEQQNTKLLPYLSSAEGRYRVRAIHHLAGGNHRMYVLLSEFLTKDSLDDLVAAFEALSEELTPYFQERVNSLPPQQGKIIQELSSANGAISVKSLAERSFIGETSCSKQLGELKKKGYVQAHKRGKKTYYEMAEPLMRLCLEVKNQHGRPLKLVAKFLRAWFPEETLKTGIKIAEAGLRPSRADQYRQAALQADTSFEADIKQTLNQEIGVCLSTEKFEKVFDLAEQLAQIDPDSAATHSLNARLNLSLKHLETENYNDAIGEITKIINLPGSNTPVLRMAYFLRGSAHRLKGEFDSALADYTAVIDMQDAPAEHKARALVIRGITYEQQDDTERALADYTAVIGMQDASAEHKARALINRGITYEQQDDTERELADYTAVIDMQDAPAEQKARALYYRGATYIQQGDTELALPDYTAVIDMQDAPAEHRAKALINRGIIYGEQGDTERELADYTAAIDMQDASAEHKARALINRGITYEQQDDTERELADYTAAIDMQDAPAEHKAKALVIRGSTYNQQGDTEREQADYTAVIDMQDAPAELKTAALKNLGVHHWSIQNYTQSHLYFEQALALIDGSLDSSVNQRTGILFSIPEALLGFASTDTVLSAIDRAFKEGSRKSVNYGGTPHDLLATVIRVGPLKWDVLVTALVAKFSKHKVLDLLGQGLTKSIVELDSGDYSHHQLDSWLSIWRQAGADAEDLEIPIQALAAAIEVIKTKQDDALFTLPIEIRELVRPLLSGLK